MCRICNVFNERGVERVRSHSRSGSREEGTTDGQTHGEGPEWET